ncbi:MAG: alkaline phosphatase [Clostridia bacterium]|nr:alkaline phosphatase [Clostridia bacterium]
MKKISSVLLVLLMVMSLIPFGVSAAEEAQIKNVIFMIGDGMGPSHLEWAKAETGEKLAMDKMPVKGCRITDSLSGLTDSAAGGTALACGLLAFNSNVGTVSVSMGGHAFIVAEYLNLCEASQKAGKKTGIITSDTNTGATPATFSAHTAKRGEAEKISAQQLECGLDLLWTAADGIITESAATAAGWTYVDNMSEIAGLEKGSKSLAQFSGKIQYDDGDENGAPLSALTASAIDLLDGSDNGFFLMIEGAHIDKYSHANEKDGMVKSLIEFDKAVDEAVKFAEKNGNTMVIVTADHETGGIVYDENAQEWKFTVGDHTATDVPLRVYGDDGMLKDGETIKNVAVARYVAKVTGLENIPSFTINKNVVADFFKALGDLISEKAGELFGN